MRKLKLLCLCGLTAAVLMTGCAGSTDTTNVNLGSATVSEYRGVKINVAAPEVTDDEVDQKIQTNLKQNPNEVEVDRAAQDGDIVNIDYKGTKDGEAFDGGTAEGQDLTLGSGSMIDGFEDGLVGAKKGETKTLDLTFPENYREESLAGQAVVFEVTVNAVKEKQDAVLDDAFVQRTSDYQTVDEYKEGIYVGYRWTDKERIKPTFAFGHGLSYTQFALSNLRSDKVQMKQDGTITFTVNVKNTGKCAGAETVQLYIHDVKASVDRPQKELKGFQKVYLQPGESKDISITISKEALSFYDEASSSWKAEAGKFEALVGNAADNLKLKKAFELF